MEPGRWIGVGFNGTLWRKSDGATLEPMVELVRQWLNDGHDVRIFTGHVAPLNRVIEPEEDLTKWGDKEKASVMLHIRLFCGAHFGRVLPITNVKDSFMEEMYDDRCVQIEHGTGLLMGNSSRGLTGNLYANDR